MLLSGAPPLSAPPAPSEREVEAGRKGRGMEGGMDEWREGGREGGRGRWWLGGERERERGRARERKSAHARMSVLIGQVHFCVGSVCVCVLFWCVCVRVCV